jgi:effector-binding domain-containing protein
MKVFKGLLLAIVLLFILFLIITVFLPSHYYVERKIEINAPQSIVYYLIDDLRNWKYWDTWWKLDTNQVRTFSGPIFGLNSKFAWSSRNKDVGNGEVAIIEEKPFEYVKLTITFGKEMHSTNTFRFMQLGDKLLVNWSMEGELKFLAKWFRFFLDKAVGKDFEEGLANIKRLSEDIVKNKVVFFNDSFPETKIIFISDSTNMDPNQISQKYAKAFQELMDFSNSNNLKHTGGPIAITRSYTEKSYVFDACLPVENPDTLTTTGRVKIGTIPAHYVLRAVYLGSYDGFEEVYSQINQYLAKHQLTPKWNFFEMYYTDPTLVKPNENITIIYCPI